MERQRPRRALQAPWRQRVARLALPGLMAGLATTGVVAVATGATATPQSGLSAATSAAPSTTPSAAGTSTREQGTSRSGAERPALTPAAAAALKAEAAADAKKKAAAKKADAERKAAARTKADAEKVAQARKKAAAEKRAEARKAQAARPSLEVVDTEYTRVDLNVREEADVDSDLITVLSSGSRVSVTGTVRGAWQHVAYRGNGGWVKKQYLVESKPKAAAKASSSGGGGLSGAACSGGSSVESGLTADAIRVHRAICARFPGVTAYGGVRADSLPEHPSGRALDAMVSSQGLGQEIANWVRGNARQLGVSEVIFAQRIWTVQRGGEGWRSMPDRGSASANHYDHVHVTVYGNAGG